MGTGMDEVTAYCGANMLAGGGTRKAAARPSLSVARAGLARELDQ